MKIRERIQRSPAAEVVAGVGVRFLRAADRATLGVGASDADGYVAFQYDGNPGPMEILIAGQPGGARHWTSYDAMSVGALSLAEVPHALRVLGDGVIRGVLNELAVAVGSGDSVTLATGAALVAGIPVVNYALDALTFSRPAASTRIDCVIVRVDTTDGEAVFTTLQGVEGGSAPALTQTAATYEICLARLTIPVAAPITIADVRTYAGETLDAAGVVRLASGTTSDTAGAAVSGASLTLDLVSGITSDIVAEASAVTRGRAGALAIEIDGNLSDYFANGIDDTITIQAIHTNTKAGGSCLVQVFARSDTNLTDWGLQATHAGPGSAQGFLNAPGQLCMDTTTGYWVCDPGNNRIHRFVQSSGAASSTITLTTPSGVAVDASGRIYVAYRSAPSDYRIRRYTGAGALVWTSGNLSATALGHLASDGTKVYYTRPSGNTVAAVLCSDGTTTTPTFGSAGTGNGEFTTPTGIVTNGTHLWVVDQGNNRVQQFTTAGVYVAQFGAAGSAEGQFNAPRGIALDDSGDLWVADYGNARLQQFSSAGSYLGTILQSAPDGVDLATGDVLFVSNNAASTIAKWDEVANILRFDGLVLNARAVPRT